MNTFKEKYGPVALVAGASKGLGAAYARALAFRGLDLVLVAREPGALEETAAQLSAEYGIRTWTVVCDLRSPDATSRIALAIGDLSIGLVVYNAALSYIGPYLGAAPSFHQDIAAVNMLTPLSLLHHFGGKMVERRRGGIVIMASLAGFQGSGNLATYAATKAFLRVLAEGLWYEWSPLGVDVIACCAGATATPNYLDTHPRKASLLEPRAQRPEEVVEECLRRLGKTPSFVSGRANRLATFFMHRILPRKMAISLMGDSLKKIYFSAR
jgi:short-subunit dehydrogenase